MSVPIQAIDAAAETLQKLEMELRCNSWAWGEKMPRSIAEEWARQMLEAVELKCAREFEICEDCGEQRRSILW